MKRTSNLISESILRLKLSRKQFLRKSLKMIEISLPQRFPVTPTTPPGAWLRPRSKQTHILEVAIPADLLTSASMRQTPKRMSAQDTAIPADNSARALQSAQTAEQNRFYPALSDTQYIFYIDTHTHIHREHLSHYELKPQNMKWGAAFTGAWELPRNLCSLIGYIPINKMDIDKASDRLMWQKMRQQCAALPIQSNIFTKERLPLIPGGNALQVISAHGELSRPYPYTEYKTLWDSATTNMQVECILQTPMDPTQLLVVFDGNEFYHCAPLGGLRENTALLLVTGANRTCFLGDIKALHQCLQTEILPWARNVLGHAPMQVAVTGGSLGGYATLELVRQYPQHYPTGIAQSAALWWEKDVMTALNRWRTWTPPQNQNTTIHTTAGDFDIYLLEENLALAKILDTKAREHPTVFTSIHRQFCGGHDYLNWRRWVGEIEIPQ
ncbi:MAG: alpha/beta hydrolase-fold protein [Corynebacterium sp.]|nr:alpha/beta hydrolase-fold protein [Corynebacterium sp.]